MNKVLALIALIGMTSFMLYQNGTTIGLDQAKSTVSEFQQWKNQFGFQFTQEENVYRFSIYMQNKRQIESHNADSSKTYTQGINQFAAMTNAEWKAIYLGLKTKSPYTPPLFEVVSSIPDINWVTKGAVTPIKNQGQCGSCWAFSTTGSLEGLSFIGYGTLQSFSEQMLVDCSTSYGNQGCNGGLMDDAFKFVEANGIVTEAQYPYTATQGKCKIKTGPFKISGYTDVTKGNCNDLYTALETQPISVAVDASDWQFYITGTFALCGKNLDHGVLLVGYNNSPNYLLVKNSWGTSWGIKGFIHLAVGDTCGICTMPSYPLK